MNGVALIGVVFVVWLGTGLLVARLFRINRQDKDNES
jgi:hypothetical protein